MRKQICAAGIVVVTAALIAGCSGPSSGDDLSAYAPKQTTAAVGSLKFSGPYASDFASAYRHAKDPDELEALSDGKITDREYTYFVSKITSCLSDLGVKATYKEGNWDYTRPHGVPDSRVDGCLSSSGQSILSLAESVKQNPRNIDEDAVMAACLVRKKVVPDGYTAEDYKRELESDNFTFDPNSSAFEECNSEDVPGQ
jgi:hypothetical protein